MTTKTKPSYTKKKPLKILNKTIQNFNTKNKIRMRNDLERYYNKFKNNREFVYVVVVVVFSCEKVTLDLVPNDFGRWFIIIYMKLLVVVMYFSCVVVLRKNSLSLSPISISLYSLISFLSVEQN